MHWRDDPALFSDVYTKLPKKVQRSVGANWVLSAIEECDNQAWDDPEIHEGNIKDIVKKARAFAKRKGVKDAPTALRNREYESAGLGQSYATRSAMQKRIEKLRLKYWGESSPPFEMTDVGFQEAANWFYVQEERDAANYPDEFPATAEVRFKLSTRKAASENAALQRLLLDSPHSQELALAVAQQFVAVAESGDAAFISYSHSGYRNETIDLSSFVPSDKKSKVRAVEGETLHNLLEDVRSLAAASSWWIEVDALTTVLFDNFISAQVRVGGGAGIRKGVPFREIILTITAPVTGKEVEEAYTAALKRFGVKPKTFTMMQSALFQLHLEYPYSSATHAERYAVWQEWRKTNPKLKNYQNKDSLRSSLESALKAARESWGRNMGFEDIFRPYASRPEQ